MAEPVNQAKDLFYKEFNIEHRTSNIERPIMMALRFVYFKTNELR